MGLAPRVFDLSLLTPSVGFLLQGETGDTVGWSVSAAGDVNGDGIDDLIIGAPYGDNGGYDAGEAYVIFGRVGVTRGNIDLTTLSATDGFIIQGDADGDLAGLSVSSAGDVNGDGIDDMIVAARRPGEAYVIFGRTGAARGNIDLTTLSATDGFVIQGAFAGYGAGRTVSSAGDVNGDGINDMIIGAPRGNNGGTRAGEAYVIFGRAGATRGDIDVTTLSATDGFVIQGDEAGDYAGWSVSSAGDVNGDGIDDVIVGASQGDNGGTDAGETYVIFGRAGATRTNIDLTTLSATDGFIIQGDAAGDASGTSVSSVGDVNGDGIDDLIVGASQGDNGGINAGEAYVIFGRAGTTRTNIDLTTLSATDGFIIQGDAAGDTAGWSVSSAGDVNDDGIDDLIVGALHSNNGGQYAGEAYVIFGRVGATRGNIDLTTLSATDGFVIRGDAAGDFAGWSVSSAGDVNGDGIDDLIVGAAYSNLAGNRAGGAYVVYGSRDIGGPQAPWAFSYTAPADMLTFAHLSADSYNGPDPFGKFDAHNLPVGWTVLPLTSSTPTAGMEATAYRDATGRVVIAYRGTDHTGELLATSVPLGLGINVAADTLQAAVDFYMSVVDSVVAMGGTAADISFTGHSLGGMLAGFMAGATGSQGMIFASGPHNLMESQLRGQLNMPAGYGFLPGAFDYSDLRHVRINGEVLGEAVQHAPVAELVLRGILAAGVAANPGNWLTAAVLNSVVELWGSVETEGNSTLMPEIAPPDVPLSGLSPLWPTAVQSAFEMINLHSMPLHLLMLYAQSRPELAARAFADVPGLIWSLFRNDVAGHADGGRYAGDDSAGLMFLDIVLSAQDGRENVLLPLLNDAEQILARLDGAGIGLGFNIAAPLRTPYFESRVIEAISAHFVETAARALISEGVGGISYTTAQGVSILGLAGGVGIAGEWLRLRPHSFTTINATQGLLDLQATIMRTMGLNVPTVGLVSLASDISILLNPDAGQTMTGSARNDLVIGAVDSGGGGVWISGLGGNDVLVGSSGNDTLYGGSGQNYLIGGMGDDRYVASAVAGSQTVLSDLGGQDQLTLQGTIVGYSRQSGFAYITNDLSLEIGSQGATVSILDHYFTRLLDGIGHIERIVNSDGAIWRPTTIAEQAFGVLRHTVNSVVSGTTALVTTAIDAVDEVVGTIAEYGTRAVHAIEARAEDVFRFLDVSFLIGSAVIRAILPNNRLATLAPGDPTSHVIDIDANSDGIVDASITLLGSYVGLGLSVTGDGADTIIRLTLDPALQFDITGDDILNDTLAGTALAERIGGLGGNDSLSGLAGDDTLMGGAGNDTIAGGVGVDRMFGGLGNDLYVVNEVEDIVIEFFGEGTDTISASVSYELLTPVENLVLTGIANLNGTGNSLNNRITGNGAANRLSGLDGQDAIMAGLGNDTVDGGTGNDALYGGDGNDLMFGGIGNDRIDGGLGSDRAYFTGTTAATVNLSLITAQVTGFGTDTLLGIEHLSSGSGNDRLTGDTLGNSLISGAGNDTVDGGAGNDALYGGDGNDLMVGSLGNDRIDGGLGSDRAYFTGTFTATVNLSILTAQVTGYGTDTLTGIEHLSSGSGNDTLTGDAFSNSLVSGAGNDTVNGGAGNDAFYGGAGNDLLSGGAGNDRFSYAAQSEAGDRVSDFIATDDSFVFQAIGFNVFQAGSFSNLAIGSLNAASFRVGSTNIAADGNDFFIFRSTDTTLWFDADGNGAQQSAILIADLQTGATMSATDVLLI